MPPIDKKASDKDDLLKAVQEAAAAEQKAAEVTTPPEFVEVDGVRYYRARTGPAPSEKTDKEGKPFEFVTLDLAPHANEIRLDGVRYLHGRTYEVPAPVAAVLRDQMSLTWQHERQTGGANVLAGGRGPRGHHIDAGGGVHLGARA